MNSAENRLQLGLFGLNLHYGATMADLPGGLKLSWDNVLRLGRKADRMGLEALVPVARWKGYGGFTDYGGVCYDTLCWAAGLGAATEQIRVMSTIHMPTIHPAVAAKQLMTIDHISGGRAGVNVVGGWYRPELEMFGHDMLEHDRRYELGEEWVKILRRLWTEDEEFDFDGEFFTMRKALCKPKPLQNPRPPIMNAGTSGRGQRFAAEYADMVFIIVDGEDHEADRRKVAAYKDMARDDFGSEVAVWTSVTVIPAATNAEAKALERTILEIGDYEAVENMLRTMGIETAVLDGVGTKDLQASWILGGSAAITGDPETVAASLARLSESGIDGTLLIFPEWDAGLDMLETRILPLLEQEGLRLPAKKTAAAHL
ncbi:LLM class flavin-dependent oxidoreductase [Amycolatopsis sp. K13G38]|uniref:LLM class flavin-dependent oxidoreductase n=1 Tax=Amycolatopsis acididurans TaxID=2724524 RepID=A0ABX1J1V7_9PSEU|nr:LLM class flavin-dependent oxidoreductase [Amycolatopsis acididurans]NKQ52267.1 LLM class flavin-dependent oxidoreductase [Amycolatopsis acididurans]